MMQRREILTATLGTALLSAVGLAQAQSTKTVRIVVPFAAGGVQDTLARALAQALGVRPVRALKARARCEADKPMRAASASSVLRDPETAPSVDSWCNRV